MNYKRSQSGRQFFMETMLPFIAQQKSTVSIVFLTLCGLEGPHSHRSHQEVPHPISTSSFTMVAMALVLGHRGIRQREESNKNKHNRLGVTGRHEEIKVCLRCKCNPHDPVDLKMPCDGFHQCLSRTSRALLHRPCFPNHTLVFLPDGVVSLFSVYIFTYIFSTLNYSRVHYFF